MDGSYLDCKHLDIHLMARPQLVDQNVLSCRARVGGANPLLLLTSGYPLEVLGQHMTVVVLHTGVSAAGALDCQGELQGVLFSGRLG